MRGAVRRVHYDPMLLVVGLRVIMEGKKRVNRVRKSGHVVALKDKLAHESAAVIWVAHRLSHQERVLDLGVVRQAQVTEHVV